MKRKCLILVTVLSLLFSTNALASNGVVNNIKENDAAVVNSVVQPTNQKVYNLYSYKTLIDSIYPGYQTCTINVIDSNAEVYFFVEHTFGTFQSYYLNKGESITFDLMEGSRYSIRASTKSPTGSDTVTLAIEYN